MVQYFDILAKFWIFSFSREILCSSACSAWKALVQDFFTDILKRYVWALAPINGFKIGSKARFLEPFKILSAQKRQILYKKSSGKTSVHDIY